jgi:hypothetical protein
VDDGASRVVPVAHKPEKRAAPKAGILTKESGPHWESVAKVPSVLGITSVTEKERLSRDNKVDQSIVRPVTITREGEANLVPLDREVLDKGFAGGSG